METRVRPFTCEKKNFSHRYFLTRASTALTVAQNICKPFEHRTLTFILIAFLFQTRSIQQFVIDLGFFFSYSISLIIKKNADVWDILKAKSQNRKRRRYVR